ncbi:MAG: ACT domain-containing protein [Armatimonadota bacterium]|nr:ACT domain-containing protein [Armatimonadota bacterium]
MIIITAVGADRPGMVHAVADVLWRAGYNIEDTTMTRLSGEFAMILIVSRPPQFETENLAQRLAPLERSHGLFINCKEFSQEPAAFSDLPRYILSVYGPDRRGLVARISGVLAEHNVNITDLQTRVASAGTVYVMIFEIELPADLHVDTLQAALEVAAHELGVQLSLHPLEEETL